MNSNLSIFRFPAQETIGGMSKVPSIIYYDTQGRVKAIGAEAIKDGIYEAAIEGNWYKAEWHVSHQMRSFILHNSITGQV